MKATTMTDVPPSALASAAADRGARALARRRAQEAERQAERAIEQARNEVSTATLTDRFAQVAAAVAQAVDAHALAAGLALDPAAPVSASSLTVWLRGGDSKRPSLALQRHGAALHVTIRGVDRGETWAPVDLDVTEFGAPALAERIIRGWFGYAEAAALLQEVTA